jgi:hypothetical protein
MGYFDSDSADALWEAASNEDILTSLKSYGSSSSVFVTYSWFHIWIMRKNITDQTEITGQK